MALTLIALGLLGPALLVQGASESCPANSQVSCKNTTMVADLCCFNAPGGSLLQTQFWDTSPSTGPTNSWTIHGLWPDHCDGTYSSNCDSSRAYTNIAGILTSFGQTSTLSYMQTYWKNDPDDGTDEEFWEHEWAQHGTCISTLNPSCYSGYQSKQEASDFFVKVVSLFQTLPTYTWLANAGITPSTTKTYTSAQIQSALSSSRGHQAAIVCVNGALNAVYYYFNVQGSVQTGNFIAADPDSSASNCPSTGIKYLPKTGSTAPTGTTTTTSTAPTGTGGAISGSGTINVLNGSTQDGCVISAGTWYTTGTCATFTATPSGSGFTLTSSKGKCAISSGALTCASSVTTATVFTSSGGQIAYSGSTSFYAPAVASGSTQETIYTTSKSVALKLVWAAA
ncbi:ribonuclease M [Microthyrium microscopicum]|uniref:Ribonuclease T2-like n=1 Tax=Microthyrium microscopicum TaxID=703497 RepID=A0A6A6TYC9_9PEZI|nr:ribonuclease M [Microthyrium microscopicum]